MKKLLVLAVGLLAMASTAHAQAGLNLNWNGCVGDGRVTGASFLCNTNTGATFGAFASIVLPTDLTAFAATTAIVDVGFTGATIPAWWQTGTGQCRAGSVSFSADPNTITNGGAGGCLDIWGGSAQVLGVFQPQPSVHGLPNELRLNGGAAIPAGTEIAWAADGTEFVVAKFTINRAKTTGTGSCAGCTTGACLTLNECFVQQPNPLPGYRVTNAASANSNFITFQSGAPACPSATPSQNRTWGAVKNLYR